MSDEENKPYSFLSGFQNWPALTRFLICISACSLVLLLTIKIIVSFILPSSYIDSIEINEAGAIEFKFGGRKDIFIVQLSASSMWHDSGIELLPDEKVSIKASGSVHLGIHRLIEAAKEDRFPKITWIGPKGGKQSFREKDIHRRDYLLDPNEPCGALLVYLQRIGINGDPRTRVLNACRTFTKTDSNQIYNLANKETIHNPYKERVRLWFSVNEMLLTQDAEHAYMGFSENLTPGSDEHLLKLANDETIESYKNRIRDIQLGWLMSEKQNTIKDNPGTNNTKSNYKETLNRYNIIKTINLSDITSVNERTSDEKMLVGEFILKDMENKWEYINKNKYWNIWFDDNVGSYLIKVTRIP